MSLSNTEFAAIMQDGKEIAVDIYWHGDEDDSPARSFRAEVASNGGWSLFIQGHYNQRAQRLTYALILRSVGRIYGLCLGNDHHNPQCTQAGRKHMHRWTERYQDKEAHNPATITAPVNDPAAVWRQFCASAGIRHHGRMLPPQQASEAL